MSNPRPSGRVAGRLPRATTGNHNAGAFSTPAQCRILDSHFGQVSMSQRTGVPFFSDLAVASPLHLPQCKQPSGEFGHSDTLCKHSSTQRTSSPVRF